VVKKIHSKTICLLLVCLIWTPLCEVVAQTSRVQPIATLSYRELIQNKELYFDKTVRVKAFHIYGFEWSFLCDSDCGARQTKTWVEFADEDDLCRGSKRRRKKGSDDFDNKAEVVYVGKLSSGSFGHFGAYGFQFTVNCVEKFKKLKVELK
jgi:hypothetical protein